MFHNSADSLDDLMRAVFKRLLSNKGNQLVKSKKGTSTEVFGALLELRNPRARLSRSQTRARVFSALGELLWYLAGDDSLKFIKYYIPSYEKYSNDGKILNGAYGPRIFSGNATCQDKNYSNWRRVISKLKLRSGSRNAVIQIYRNDDDRGKNEDIPCTCTLQFVIRADKLHLHTHMRSNDALFGLPHDIFSFTMLQEIAARELDVELGFYYHSVASLHLYHDDEKNGVKSFSQTAAQKFLREGWFEEKPMPIMPLGDPWPSIEKLLQYEAKIRNEASKQEPPKDLLPYWNDLAILLLIHKMFRSMDTSTRQSKRQTFRDIITLSQNMDSDVYRIYIQDRLTKKDAPMRDLFSDID